MRDEEIYAAFGQQLAARRDRLQKSQKEVAAKVGLSRASIANIESGRQGVLLHHVYALAHALEMDSIADLLPANPSARVYEPISVPMTGVAPGSKEAEEVALMISMVSRPALRAKK